MAQVIKGTNSRVRTLSKDEGQKLFDRQAQRYLGMSGDEFIKAWWSGRFKKDDRPEVTRVAMLLPFAHDSRD